MVIIGSLIEEVKEISLQDLTFATKKKKKRKSSGGGASFSKRKMMTLDHH